MCTWKITSYFYYFSILYRITSSLPLSPLTYQLTNKINKKLIKFFQSYSTFSSTLLRIFLPLRPWWRLSLVFSYSTSSTKYLPASVFVSNSSLKLSFSASPCSSWWSSWNLCVWSARMCPLSTSPPFLYPSS